MRVIFSNKTSTGHIYVGIPMKILLLEPVEMGFDAFLLSNYRNVGFAYPWMRPPHEFYANIPITHYDGIDIKQSFSLDNGDFLSLKAYAGYTSTQLSEDYYDAEIEGPMVGANVIYETGNWRFRTGYTYIRQVVDIDAQDLKLQINDPTTNFLFPNLNQLASTNNL